MAVAGAYDFDIIISSMAFGSTTVITSSWQLVMTDCRGEWNNLRNDGDYDTTYYLGGQAETIEIDTEYKDCTFSVAIYDTTEG